MITNPSFCLAESSQATVVARNHPSIYCRAVQERIGIDQSGQPIEALCPLLDRLGARRPMRPVRRLKAVVAASDGTQQPIQDRGNIRLQPRRDQGRHACVDLGPQMVDQPIQRAEGRQVDRGFAQDFNGSIDQVGRIAHDFSSLKNGGCDRLFGRFVKKDETLRWARTLRRYR